MENLFTWVSSNWIEIAGALISLVYLYFSYKQIILLWPFGILSALFYTWIYFDSGFYADMGLQVYYLGISVYGWYYWSGSSNDNEKNQKRKISHINSREILGVSAAFLIIWIAISFILIKLTDSEVPVMDGFTTAGGIAATWMLARKLLQHWLVWIIVDTVSLGLYIYKGLHATAFLFLVYTLVAIAGYFAWKKTMKQYL